MASKKRFDSSSALPQFASPSSIRRVVTLQIVLAIAIVILSAVGALAPSLVPGVPAPKSAPAIALFAIGLCVYGALAVRGVQAPAVGDVFRSARGDPRPQQHAVLQRIARRHAV